MAMTRDDATIERRLQREASEVCLGTLGDREHINVAKVEVSWYWDEHRFPYGPSDIREEAGHYIVHASGNDENIYDTFDRLVTEAMEARQERIGFDWWQIDDTYATRPR